VTRADGAENPVRRTAPTQFRAGKTHWKNHGKNPGNNQEAFCALTKIFLGV
jgi:hypothetical protein